MNICHDYASFVPRALIRAGLEQLPSVLGVQSDELDTTTVLARHPVMALFVSGTEDSVIPLPELRRLYAEALPGSELIVVPGATHETLPYRFNEIVPPVLGWLNPNEPVSRSAMKRRPLPSRRQLSPVSESQSQSNRDENAARQSIEQAADAETGPKPVAEFAGDQRIGDVYKGSVEIEDKTQGQELAHERTAR